MSYLFSIITATFNSAETVNDCLNSVASQNCAIEHIIIDGASTDSTINMVETCSGVSKIISEQDDGIYDAMNKGIGIASGEIIGFLNSDDFYTNQRVLSDVAEVFTNPSIDSCYGDIVYVDHENTDKIIRHWKAGEFSRNKFYFGWMPPHPTFFVRRWVYEKYGMFNLDLGSSADYELMLRFLFKHRISSAYIPDVLVKMRTGGMSNASIKNRIRANHMDRLAWRVNALQPLPGTSLMKPIRKISQFVFTSI